MSHIVSISNTFRQVIESTTSLNVVDAGRRVFRDPFWSEILLVIRALQAKKELPYDHAITLRD